MTKKRRRSAEIVAERLKKNFEPYGAIQRFSEASGLPRGNLQRWVNLETTMNLDFLDRVAETLGVEPADLIQPEAKNGVSARAERIIRAVRSLEGNETALSVVEAVLEPFLKRKR